jgi:hypothetical protein
MREGMERLSALFARTLFNFQFEKLPPRQGNDKSVR